MNWEDLSFPAQMGVVAGVGIVLIVAFYFVYVQSTEDSITRVKNDIKDIIEKIDEGKRTSARLNEFKQEVTKLETKFEVYKEIIPEEIEFDTLLKYFNTIASETSVIIVSIEPPKQEKPMGFYAEYPIKIVMWGAYHSLVNFYLKIKNLKRIINVTDMTLERRNLSGGSSRRATSRRGGSQQEQTQTVQGADKPIEVQFTATTFIFLPPEKRLVETVKGKRGARAAKTNPAASSPM